MYGFEPQFHVPMLPTSVPTADERREELRQAREDATAALTLTAERMKEYYDWYVREAPEFKEGQKVWLTRSIHLVSSLTVEPCSTLVAQVLVNALARPHKPP